MVPEKLAFTPLGRRLIEADFSGGHISSDTGLLLLREVDKRHGLTRQLAGALNDPRMSSKVRHSLHSLVAQRVYGLAAGYEDFNDHQQLRFDPILQSTIGRDQVLAGKSTLSRMERGVDRRARENARRVALSVSGPKLEAPSLDRVPPGARGTRRQPALYHQLVL